MEVDMSIYRGIYLGLNSTTAGGGGGMFPTTDRPYNFRVVRANGCMFKIRFPCSSIFIRDQPNVLYQLGFSTL